MGKTLLPLDVMKLKDILIQYSAGVNKLGFKGGVLTGQHVKAQQQKELTALDLAVTRIEALVAGSI